MFLNLHDIQFVDILNNIYPKESFTFKLKSKGYAKRDNSIGTINKDKIWRILLPLFQRKEPGTGVMLKEILRENNAKIHSKGLSKPSVINALEKLQAEDKLYKSKARYYLAEFFRDDGWSIFADYLNFFLKQSFFISPSDSIRSSQSSIDGDIEKILFHFTNQIGAFILYVLIEAIRPTRRLIPRTMRIEKAKDFLQDAIPYLDLLSALLSSLPEPYRNNIVLGAQMKENSFNKLSDAFRNMYPHFSKDIEQGYSEYFQNFYLDTIDDYRSCRHEWKEVFVHKIGKQYKCRKCRAFAKSLPSN